MVGVGLVGGKILDETIHAPPWTYNHAWNVCVKWMQHVLQCWDGEGKSCTSLQGRNRMERVPESGEVSPENTCEGARYPAMQDSQLILLLPLFYYFAKRLCQRLLGFF